MTTHDEAVEAVEAKFHSQVWRAIMPRSRPGVAYDVAYPRVLDHMLVIQNRSALRDWWHSVLRDYGKHKCYGLFLVLPGDVKAIRYLARSGEELELISRNDCAILVMSDVTCASRPPRISEDTWAIAIDEYITHGHQLHGVPMLCSL